MSEASFNSFFNKPFGLNVQVPERTLKQAGSTLNGTASGILKPALNYLEENEEVFTGEVAQEIKKIHTNSFNIGSKMRQEDERVNGRAPKFDSNF